MDLLFRLLPCTKVIRDKDTSFLHQSFRPPAMNHSSSLFVFDFAAGFDDFGVDAFYDFGADSVFSILILALRLAASVILNVLR